MFGFGKKKGISFSVKRLTGISGLKSSISSKTGIPLTKGGVERKVGRKIIKSAVGKIFGMDTLSIEKVGYGLLIISGLFLVNKGKN